MLITFFNIVPYGWYEIIMNFFLPSGPLTQYRTLVQQEKLRYDPNQEKVAVELDNLLGRLEQYEKAMEEYHV